MTIKKTIKVKRPTAAPAGAASAAAPSAPGGATIADRFRLDAPDPKAIKAAASNRKSAAVAFFAALIALGVAGFLVYTLYKHWEFLMPA